MVSGVLLCHLMSPVVNEPFYLEGNHTSGPMSTSGYEICVDGAEIQSPTAIGTGTLNIPSNPRIGLGHSNTAGDMFESWIYSRSVAGAEIYDRKQYLDRKWRMVADYNKAPGGVQRGLSIWLDGNDSSTMFQDSCGSALTAVSSNGNPVGCWMDKSGNGNHVSSVSGSPSFITNEFNAKSVLRFSGAEHLSVSDLLSMKGGDEAFTVFAVASTSQTTSTKTILGIGDNFS